MATGATKSPAGNYSRRGEDGGIQTRYYSGRIAASGVTAGWAICRNCTASEIWLRIFGPTVDNDLSHTTIALRVPFPRGAFLLAQVACPLLGEPPETGENQD